MSTTSTIVPIVSLPKKSKKTTSLTKASATPSTKKSSASSDKKNQRKYNKNKTTTSLDGHPSFSTQTESDDTDKSSASQQRKKRSHRGRRQQHQQQQQQSKKPSAQPKSPPQQESSTPSLPINMKRRRRSNSAVIYAGPHFMNDAPLPSSLPLPGVMGPDADGKTSLPLPSPPLGQQQEAISPHLQSLLQFHHQHRPTLYERSLAGENMDSKLFSSHKSYLMDPISEIQEKLRTMLKIQA